MKVILKNMPLAILLSACSLVPNYERPTVNLSERWMEIAIEEQANGKTAQEMGWREFFQDNQLKLLIANALEHNHNLRIAALNVQLAAEQYNIQKTDQLPMLGLNASAARSRTGVSSKYGRAVYSKSYTVGLGISSFELDFFGRVSALSEASLNQYLQTEEARDAAQLSIINGVANAYYSARINKALMGLSERVLKTRQESARLAKMQFDVGLITAVILHNYESSIESARADYYGFERQYQQSLNALSVLVGVPVEQLQLSKGNDFSKQFSSLSVPAGIPSTILQQRPDVRQAEYKLKAANANIGAAKAALFPNISLTGNAGYASGELSELLKNSSFGWTISPSINLPIFDRGKLNSAVKISEISQQIAVEGYQQTVKTAFQEVANALIAREAYDKQYRTTEKVVAAQNKVLYLERKRFKAGVTDGLTLIDAERNSFATQQGKLGVQLSLLQNMVSLYTAMGGGLSEYGVNAPVTGNELAVPLSYSPLEKESFAGQSAKTGDGSKLAPSAKRIQL